MHIDRRTYRARAAKRRPVRPCLVARALSLKVFFDGGCRPNPGAIRVAAVVRGAVHLDVDVGEGSSGRAEWLALLHALEVAATTGARDVILIGDSASVIDQARGIAPRRLSQADGARFATLTTRFDRLRFRRIRRHQNLAGIVLERSYIRGAGR